MSDDDDTTYRPAFSGGSSRAFGFATSSSARSARRHDASASDSDDGGGRPSFARSSGGGGLGFRPPETLTQGMAPEMEMGMGGGGASDRDRDRDESPPAKKMRFSKSLGGGGAGGKVGSGGAMGKSSAGGFAARMMAKMGYREGEGLGKEGHGRLAPIAAQLRPQGAGLGAVREKTKQAKEEEKRAANLRGETVQEDEDSEEEEKRRRREMRKKRQEQGLSGMGVGRKQGRGGGRTRYKTAAEIEVESGGLEVPNALKSLVDLTGKETTFTPISGQGVMVQQESEATKIARRARRDLEFFADEWSNAKEQAKYLEMENEQLVVELDRQEKEVTHVRSAVNSVEALQQLDLSIGMLGASEVQWESVTKELEELEVDFADELGKFCIQETAVAAIQPLFKASMHDWEPLSNPAYLVPYISRLQHVLGANISRQLPATHALISRAADVPPHRPSKRSTTHYETLIYSLWLPKVRSALTNEWSVEDPTPAENLLQSWRPLLPDFILSHIVRQLILPRLESSLSSWKPSSNRKSRSGGSLSSPPHHWLFPWLEYLPSSQIDPSAPEGLAVSLRRRVRSVLSHISLRDGLPTWLLPLRSPIFPQHTLSQLVTTVLLPRLSAHLKEHFTIDPADQDVASFEQVLAFRPLFSTTAFAELLVARFFPKFHATLHAWLVAPQPDYGEIEQWFTWWQETMIPPELRELPAMEAQWTAALQMINAALELGPEEKKNLPGVEAFLPLDGDDSDQGDGRDRGGDRDKSRHHHRNGHSHSRHSRTPDPDSSSRDKHQHNQKHNQKSKSKPKDKDTSNLLVPEDVTFRDIVEDFCAEHGLLFMAMREAHPTNGAPLLRITASSTGKGGVVGYVHGDVLYVRTKKMVAVGEGGWGGGQGEGGQVEKTVWKPTGLDAGLVRLAGGT